MTRELRSSTGRGLNAAVAGEIIVLVVCLLYLGTRSPRLLVVGFIIAGLVGFASIVSLWRGQDEFGPVHRRNARRGTYLFLTASLFFALSFFSFGTFTSSTTGLDFPGQEGAESPTTPHRFKDLAPPLVLLGIAIITETLSGAYFTWHLAGLRMQRWVIGYGVAGGMVAVTVFARGLIEINAMRRSFGESANAPDLADYYFDSFLYAVLPVFVIGFGLTRMLALWILRLSRDNVAQAEADDEQAQLAAQAQP